MDPVYEPTDLLGAVNLLSYRTKRLTDRVDVTDRVSKQSRLISIIGVVAVLAFIVFGAMLFLRVGRAIDGNNANAVQSCENANETRDANRALWAYALSLQEPQTPREARLVDQFGSWVKVLYQRHDCDHLDKVYEIPPPPHFQ